MQNCSTEDKDHFSCIFVFIVDDDLRRRGILDIIFNTEATELRLRWYVCYNHCLIIASGFILYNVIAILLLLKIDPGSIFIIDSTISSNYFNSTIHAITERGFGLIVVKVRAWIINHIVEEIQIKHYFMP